MSRGRVVERTSLHKMDSFIGIAPSFLAAGGDFKKISCRNFCLGSGLGSLFQCSANVSNHQPSAVRCVKFSAPSLKAGFYEGRVRVRLGRRRGSFSMLFSFWQRSTPVNGKLVDVAVLAVRFYLCY